MVAIQTPPVRSRPAHHDGGGPARPPVPRRAAGSNRCRAGRADQI